MLMGVSFSLQVFQGVQRGRERTCREAYGVPGMWRLNLLDLVSFHDCWFYYLDSEVFFYLFGLAWQELNQCWKITYLRSRFEFTRNRPDKDARDTFDRFPPYNRVIVELSSLFCLIVSHFVIEQAWRKSKAEHHLVASDGVWPCWERGCSLL